MELEKRYELKFLEIGIDKDHVHFLIQTIPNIFPSDIANTVKGNIVIQFFKKHEEVKRFTRRAQVCGEAVSGRRGII